MSISWQPTPPPPTPLSPTSKGGLIQKFLACKWNYTAVVMCNSDIHTWDLSQCHSVGTLFWFSLCMVYRWRLQHLWTYPCVVKMKLGGGRGVNKRNKGRKMLHLAVQTFKLFNVYSHFFFSLTFNTMWLWVHSFVNTFQRPLCLF